MHLEIPFPMDVSAQHFSYLYDALQCPRLFLCRNLNVGDVGNVFEIVVLDGFAVDNGIDGEEGVEDESLSFVLVSEANHYLWNTVNDH